MADILDDVKELLKRGKGDPIVLERIRRAVLQDEVVSIYERRYVERLAAEFLRPEPVYDMPKIRPPAARLPARAKKRSRPRLRMPRPKMLSKKFIIILIAAAALAGVAAAVYTGALVIGELDIGAPGTGAAPAEPGLTVAADSASYSPGDIISVSGKGMTHDEITLQILDGTRQIIWQEVNIPRSDMTYSTLLIAGDGEWSPGEYTLRAIQGGDLKETRFTFN